MRGMAVLLALGVAACASTDGMSSANASSEVRGWQTAAGKPPSQAEFAAVVAACEDRAKTASQNASIDGCLADLGLRRAQ